MGKIKIVLGITGSIAAFKAAELASHLNQLGFDVRVIMTEESEAFITPLTLQVLSGNKVSRQMFEAPENWDVEHVGLADLASFILIAPATANILGKLAHGICDDLLTCTVMAARCPVLIAPAMNTKMWEHPATQANVKILKSFGYKFIGPVKGRLACGTTGCGRMSDIEDILKSIGAIAKR